MLNATRDGGARYRIYDELARGGMGSVHLARKLGPHGFSLTVAVKRMHESFAGDASAVEMFVNEIRIAGRIRHPKVVPVLDVVEQDGALLLVMEYVHGENLAQLLKAARRSERPIPPGILSRIFVDVLEGLEAAHNATDETGQSLQIVHRDISPQNILVGADGIARLADFGIAKASTQVVSTAAGMVKGKLRYVAPEQLSGDVDRRSDIYSLGLVLWEALALQPYRVGELGALAAQALEARTPRSLREVGAHVQPDVEAILDRALAHDRGDRFQHAGEMRRQLERAIAPVPAQDVAEWMSDSVGDQLAARLHVRARIERESVAEVQAIAALDAIDVAVDFTDGASTVTGTDTSKRPTNTRGWAAWIGFGVAALSLVVIASAVLSVRATQSVHARERHDVEMVGAHDFALPRPVAKPTTESELPAPLPGATKRSGAATPRAKKLDCAIPYTVDASGVRVPRPECMIGGD